MSFQFQPCPSVPWVAQDGWDRGRKPKEEAATVVQERSDSSLGQDRGRRDRQRPGPVLPSMTSAPSSVPERRPPSWSRHRPGRGSDGHDDVMGPEGCSCHRASRPHLPTCQLGSEKLIRRGRGTQEPGAGRTDAGQMPPPGSWPGPDTSSQSGSASGLRPPPHGGSPLWCGQRITVCITGAALIIAFAQTGKPGVT